MVDFTQLSPLMRELHGECVKLYYMLLPVFFMLAVAIQWFKRSQGAVDFLDILKRTMISTLLLIAFPEITDAILSVTEGIASRIDSLSTLDKFMAVVQAKIDTYTFSKTSLILGINNLIVSIVTFLSFLVLFFARYFTVAIFHFFWMFLVVTAPLLLLFNIFAGTSQVTVALFRGLIEVACWKIVWAILGVMLASLSFSDMYMLEGAFANVTIMNLVIAIAMIATPLFVRSLAGSGVQSMGPLLAAASVAAVPKLIASGGAAIARALPQRNWQGRMHSSQRIDRAVQTFGRRPRKDTTNNESKI